MSGMLEFICLVLVRDGTVAFSIRTSTNLVSTSTVVFSISSVFHFFFHFSFPLRHVSFAKLQMVFRFIFFRNGVFNL